MSGKGVFQKIDLSLYLGVKSRYFALHLQRDSPHFYFTTLPLCAEWLRPRYPRSNLKEGCLYLFPTVSALRSRSRVRVVPTSPSFQTSTKSVITQQVKPFLTLFKILSFTLPDTPTIVPFLNLREFKYPYTSKTHFWTVVVSTRNFWPRDVFLYLLCLLSLLSHGPPVGRLTGLRYTFHGSPQTRVPTPTPSFQGSMEVRKQQRNGAYGKEDRKEVSWGRTESSKLR